MRRPRQPRASGESGLTRVLPWSKGSSGEKPDSDADVVIEGLLAPIYLRVLLSAQPVMADFLQHFIDVLLDRVVQRTDSTSRSAAIVVDPAVTYGNTSLNATGRSSVSGSRCKWFTERAVDDGRERTFR